MSAQRVFLIVLDSCGIGAEPDAPAFHDAMSCNTLASAASSPAFHIPTLHRLGLFNIEGTKGLPPVDNPLASFARLREKSQGKDTTTGHWEIAGIISPNPLPTYPHGFPPSVLARLEKAFGRKILCNKPYSGTQVIHDYGREHLETGALIVYTSADSVLQIAAHESIVPPEQLYTYCRLARQIMCGENAVGRIIARPFIGTYPNYVRTARRHDFSIEPPQSTVLDALKEAGNTVIGVGKISDIFAGRGINRRITTTDNNDGMQKTLHLLQEDFSGLCFVNLVDFDMKYGHRRDVTGYAKALTAFDQQLTLFLKQMHDDDILMITADHGCDPRAAGTDHTREYVPYLVYGKKLSSGINLGTKETFSVIAATIADIFSVPFTTSGKSIYPQLTKSRKG